MVRPEQVSTVIAHVAALLGEGEIVLFGSAALSYVLGEFAPLSRDLDIWCTPEEKGEVVEAAMGELSQYADRHDLYVEVWRPETFSAPSDWRDRSHTYSTEEILAAAPALPEAWRPAEVRLTIPHPWDILFAKLERWELADQRHARLILQHFPMPLSWAEQLHQKSPYLDGWIQEPERTRRYLAHHAALIGWLTR